MRLRLSENGTLNNLIRPANSARVPAPSHAASVHGWTQRAQAASIRPSIKAAMANENAMEKPT